MKPFLLALLLLPMLAWSGEAAVEVEIEQPWVRAVPPVSPNTAGYFKLHNHGAVERVIVGVASDAASAVEMHTVVEQDGATTMQPLHEVKIAAEDCVMFEPGAHHIMFIGLKQPLKEGDEVKLMLQFKNGDTLPILMPVKRTEDAGHHHHHH
ncbi:copper chaperone PCu(A)C [Ketobacter sp.]|uniref:copper chaperone PCu(A)C n=1 Tax=Ketobacter sp. TaxID=2083498 RepID=UPI000F245310|nr:copper chaperone PCu(A)C [Ketobacter sp.]RLT99401.1 MAG: copper chaperone PCu(A)C [Ketobacter sp.]